MRELLAALDIGSNSVLILLGEPRPDGSLAEVFEMCRVTRLGEGVDRSGVLQPTAMERTLAAIREMHAALPADSRGQGLAAATSAVRDAANGSQFLAACREILGGTPAILSGAEEAATAFRGAAAGVPSDRLLVNIDVGGGSTEIAAGQGGDCRLACSLNLGSVRFAERFTLFEYPEACQLAGAKAAIRAALEPVCRQASGLAATTGGMLVTASSGTAATFAALCLQQREYERTALHGFTAPPAQVREWLERLYAMPLNARLELPGMVAGRAAVLPTGLLILHEALDLLGAPEFAVTTRGLRYGMLLRLRDGSAARTWKW